MLFFIRINYFTYAEFNIKGFFWHNYSMGLEMKFTFVSANKNQSAMNKKVSKIIEILLCIVTSASILVLPCIWADKTMLDASLMPRMLVLSIVLLLQLLLWAFYIIKGGRFSFDRRETVIFGGIALFMLMHIVSCINAVNGFEAFFHLSKEFMFCLWFFFTYQLMKAYPSARGFLIKSITVTSAIFIGIAIWQLANADFSRYLAATDHRSFYLGEIMNNAYSTCSNKNLFASLLFITLPLAFYNIANFRRHNALSAIWCCVGAIVAITNLALVVLLLSRTIFVAIAISGVAAYIILCIYCLRFEPKNTGKPASSRLKITLIAIPAALLATGIVATTITETQIEKTVKERISLTINPEKYGYKDNEHGESSVAMRKIIWGKTLELIKEHPLVGHGPGQWQIVVPKYGVDEFGEKLRAGAMTFQRPHNDYLWITAEVGILGLAGYLIFFFGIIAIGISNIKHATHKWMVTFNILATAALIGWIFVSMVDFPHERIEHNVILLSICAIIMSSHTKPAEDTAAENGKVLTLGLLALCTAIAVIGFVQTLTFFNGEKNSRQIMNCYYNQNWNRILTLTRKADLSSYTINNFTAPTHFYKGIALSMTDNDKAAVVEFKKALKFAPYHILTLNACGTSYLKLEQYDDAAEMYAKTLSLSPHNHNALYDLAIMHYNKKDAKTAFDYISKIPLNMKKVPENIKNAVLKISRQAALADKDLYKADNLNAWLQDDNRILESIRKMQSENISFDQLLTDEVGRKN